MSEEHRYLDFEVKIEDLGDGRYRAAVVDMPLGEGQPEVSREFTLPFAADELARTLAVLSGRLDAPLSARREAARRFGERLFGAVFAGEVYTVYFSSRDRARTTAGLRIKLDVDEAGPLRDIPWEFLRDPAIDYLSLSRTTPLVRYPRTLVIRPRPRFSQPLRVLVMVSSPSDMPPVDVEAEWKVLNEATASLQSRGLIVLERLEDASLRTLQRVLRAADYHVFHYIGHSTFDQTTGQGMLALEDPLGEGSVYPVRGEDLARELSEENTIRLVVLNSCQSAVGSEADPFAGIASSLVARGIPAVVAMQYVVGERAARAFSEEFYRAVADGLPVDAAMSEGRRAISHSVDSIEWATPVLFMRAADGILFERSAPRPFARAVRSPLVMAAVAIAVVALAVLIFGLLTGGDSPKKVSADLRIGEIEIIPARPVPGQKAAIIVEVANMGEGEIGPFEYDFREDVLDPAASFTGQVSGLGAGDTATIFIPHIYGWWGAFVSEVRIDALSSVPETDEFNNIGRSPVVLDGGQPFTIAFDMLPDGTPITDSMPLAERAFAAWGVLLRAEPAEGDTACTTVTPWVIVAGDGSRYLGTGMPSDSAACTNATLIVVLERGAVGRVLAELEDVAEQGVMLVGFDGRGRDVGSTSEPIDGSMLELAGGFLPLEIAQAHLISEDGQPLRVRRLELAEPTRTGRVQR